MSQIVATFLKAQSLTYKSINDPIKTRIAELHKKELWLLPHRLGGITRRDLIVSNEVRSDVSPPYAETREGIWLEAFRASLDHYSSGVRMTISDQPHNKPPHSRMARTDHKTIKHIWDFRALKADDGVRCFGVWGGYNLFIALTWDYREKMDFKAETERAHAEWERLFPGLTPFAAKSVEDYGSNFVDY